MPNAILYHNPRCTKSRQALSYLHTTALEFELKEYLKEGLSLSEVTDLLSSLDFPHAVQMIRPKEAEFAQAGLSKTSSSEDILEALVDYPKLLERPILLLGKKAAIGRPLANIETLVNA